VQPADPENQRNSTALEDGSGDRAHGGLSPAPMMAMRAGSARAASSVATSWRVRPRNERGRGGWVERSAGRRRSHYALSKPRRSAREPSGTIALPSRRRFAAGIVGSRMATTVVRGTTVRDRARRRGGTGIIPSQLVNRRIRCRREAPRLVNDGEATGCRVAPGHAESAARRSNDSTLLEFGGNPAVNGAEDARNNGKFLVRCRYRCRRTSARWDRRMLPPLGADAGAVPREASGERRYRRASLLLPSANAAIRRRGPTAFSSQSGESKSAVRAGRSWSV
jgi:hypothetical protein